MCKFAHGHCIILVWQHLSVNHHINTGLTQLTESVGWSFYKKCHINITWNSVMKWNEMKYIYFQHLNSNFTKNQYKLTQNTTNKEYINIRRKWNVNFLLSCWGYKEKTIKVIKALQPLFDGKFVNERRLTKTKR